MITHPIICFGSNALEIRDDATITVIQGGSQTFSDLGDLTEGIRDLKPYASYEPDMWVLDGTYKFMPAAPHVGYMSTAMSGSDGAFAAPVPMIRLAFASVHSTDGITLRFLDDTDWSDSITVAFYNASNVLIRTDDYTPSSWQFSTGQAVASFKRIDISFNSTNSAYRFARLMGIDLDTTTTFTGAAIKSARLVEQINVLSTELPFNTLDFSLFSADGDFSITDPQGVYANLQENQPIDAYESMGGEMIYLGRFYLEKWESQNEKYADFKTVDLIGILDNIELTAGLITRLDVGSNVAQLMTEIGVAYENFLTGYDYAIGWLASGTMRDALKHYLLARAGFASCARSNKIKILPYELASDLTEYDFTLTGADKGQQSPVTLRPYVTGVNLKYKFHILDDAFDDTISYQATLDAGTYIIMTPHPFNGIASMTGATYIIGYSSYFQFSVASLGTVTITYYVRKESGDTVSINNGSLPAGASQNVLLIDNVNIVYDQSAMAQRVYDYYQQRFIQKTRLYSSQIKVGDSVLIDTQSSKQIKGIVEKMTTDLCGGFVSDLEIVGVIAA